MKHPLGFIPSELRRQTFIFLLISTLFVVAVFQLINPPLITAAAPQGIISFELAGTVTKAQEIIASWDERARLFAAFSLGFDYLFMPLYAFTLSLGILLVGSRRSGWWIDLSAWLGWGQFSAAALDGLENLALWKLLVQPVMDPWPQVAAVVAYIKFTLILLGLFFIVAGWIKPKKS